MVARNLLVVRSPLPPSEISTEARKSIRMIARRALVAGLVAASLPAPPQRATASLAPPPVSRVLEFSDCVRDAAEFSTVQIATQHDHVVGITHDGQRVVCVIPDAAFPDFLLETMSEDGLPFRVLPMNPVRAAVRDVAQGALGGATVTALLLTPFGIWQNR